MGDNILDQELQIAVGKATEELAKFLKSKDWNIFVSIIALEITKQMLTNRTLEYLGSKEKI